jgi:hypothetical protein
VAAEAEQASVMAIVDDLQGDLVPTLRLDGEAVVAERREQAPRTGE